MSSAVAAALLRMILTDPYQAYDFECTLHRPGGHLLTVNGSIGGRDSESRVATIRSESPLLATGAALPVEISYETGTGVIDRETVRTSRGETDYVYIFDRSIPFEDRAIGLTVVGFEVTADNPVRVSALGFCRTRDVLEEEPSQ
jgi:hypothetical protein